uniref:Uncharacterized protein n=1 Tax=Arundo donax TaxID=35708 RepID=A0A0A8YMH2_ARUDO
MVHNQIPLGSSGSIPLPRRPPHAFLSNLPPSPPCARPCLRRLTRTARSSVAVRCRRQRTATQLLPHHQDVVMLHWVVSELTSLCLRFACASTGTNRD